MQFNKYDTKNQFSKTTGSFFERKEIHFVGSLGKLRRVFKMSNYKTAYLQIPIFGDKSASFSLSM